MLNRNLTFLPPEIPYMHEVYNTAPTKLMYSSDGLGWNGVVVRTYDTKQFYDMSAAGVPPILVGEVKLFLHLQGVVELTRRFDGKTLKGRSYPGSIVIQPRGTHAEAAWTSAATVAHIHLTTSIFDLIVNEESNVDPANLEIIHHFLVQDSFIDAIGRNLTNEIQSVGLYGEMYAEGLANTLALHLIRNYSAAQKIRSMRGNGLSRMRLLRATEFIGEHLDQTISLAELASLVGLSIPRFAHLFKASTGLAPYQYVIQKRVERAQCLLQMGGVSVAEVATLVGFTDQSHMTKHFKRLLGVTPKMVLSSSRNVPKDN